THLWRATAVTRQYAVGGVIAVSAIDAARRGGTESLELLLVVLDLRSHVSAFDERGRQSGDDARGLRAEIETARHLGRREVDLEMHRVLDRPEVPAPGDHRLSVHGLGRADVVDHLRRHVGVRYARAHVRGARLLRAARRESDSAAGRRLEVRVRFPIYVEGE